MCKSCWIWRMYGVVYCICKEKQRGKCKNVLPIEQKDTNLKLKCVTGKIRGYLGTLLQNIDISITCSDYSFQRWRTIPCMIQNARVRKVKFPDTIRCYIIFTIIQCGMKHQVPIIDCLIIGMYIISVILNLNIIALSALT